ncbi:hypothetical protein VUR80DRAFT_2819 [Thermomyces stellatus]
MITSLASVKADKLYGPHLSTTTYRELPPSPVNSRGEPFHTEFTCFSYDDDHVYRHDESGLRWYYHYPLDIGVDLSQGFETFDKHDDSQDEHLVSLLKSIVEYEKMNGKVEAAIVTWRGMMTKILTAPFESRDGFEMNATSFQGTIFIEENHEYKIETRRKQERERRPGRFTSDEMSYWGYKFETLCTLPRPWGEVSRTEIEARTTERVSNKAQYCSIVTTNMGPTKVCMGGEVDALWGSKPKDPNIPPEWVELKTSVTPRSDRDIDLFHAKLLKFWAQSYLIGASRVIVGFRTRDGMLESVKELWTAELPGVRPRNWDADVCVDFAVDFLQFLRKTITDEGVWRIRRQAGRPFIEVFRVTGKGHGDILTEEFVAWRTSGIKGGEG